MYSGVLIWMTGITSNPICSRKHQERQRVTWTMTNVVHLIRHETWGDPYGDKKKKKKTVQSPDRASPIGTPALMVGQWLHHHHSYFSATQQQAPNLAHTALIFQMLFEHLNFWTSISGPGPALINGPHLSLHHVVRGPCPARQLCFRIMGALHPSPYHAMIGHLCDLSVKPLCQKGQQGMVKVEAITGVRGWGGGSVGTACNSMPFFFTALCCLTNTEICAHGQQYASHSAAHESLETRELVPAINYVGRHKHSQ